MVLHGELGGERENRGDGAHGAIGPHDELWRRDDRADWTPELACAHAAFETGREWGGEWVACVQKFFDFEATWGYDEGRGRWRRNTGCTSLLGRREATGQAEELWVRLFWAWWRTLELGNRELSRPEKADWSILAQMHGNNGLLQVMAALVWWGKVVRKRGEEEQEEWLVAVHDIT
ncbi:hypothetical protein B0H14DRAFT_3752785 [Mycena olivaceomarginata]|nr:hypothetical protein B0H14DRAFT_3752785 [Mycena olivaceomarginata]